MGFQFSHRQLGQFEWDAANLRWRGSLSLTPKRSVPLEIVPDDPDDREAVFRGAPRIANLVRRRASWFLQSIAAELVGRYNAQYPDDRPVSLKDFQEWIAVHSVCIAESGGFDLVVTGEGLFTDVQPVATFDAKGSLLSIFFAGLEA